MRPGTAKAGGRMAMTAGATTWPMTGMPAMVVPGSGSCWGRANVAKMKVDTMMVVESIELVLQGGILWRFCRQNKMLGKNPGTINSQKSSGWDRTNISTAIYLGQQEVPIT